MFETNFVKYLCAYKWKCVNKKCNAKIYVNESLTEIFKYDIDHQNHEKLPINVLENKLFSNQLKRKLTNTRLPELVELILAESMLH